MKILIIGGHLSPAMSVIENLKNHEVFYVGRKYAIEGDSAVSLEFKEIDKIGIPFFNLETARLQRKFTRHTVPSLLKFPRGLVESYLILKKIKPDVILGFGGYVQVPLILAAKSFNIPTVIHEQTFEAGLSNRAVARLVTKICISWDSSSFYFPKEKTVLTGLPIKKELIELKMRKQVKNKRPILYITGGSLGSHMINQLVSKSLDNILNVFTVIHQTGDSQVYRDYESLLNKKNDLNSTASNSYSLSKFLSTSEAILAMKKADIVVARSGINTVLELLYLEKPSFLIPISYSQKNEQLKNAQFLKDAGLAEIGDENNLNSESFVVQLKNMYSNISKYKINRSEKFNFDNAAVKIVRILEDVCKKEKA